MMNLHDFFILTFRIWFGLQLLSHLIGLTFISLLPIENHAHGYGMAHLIIGITISYLMFSHMHINYERIQQTDRQFHRWVWLLDDEAGCLKVLMSLVFVVWFISGCVVLGGMAGVTYVLGGWFVISMFYWFVVGCYMLKSYRELPPVVYV